MFFASGLKRRQRADGAQEDAHRVRVVLEALHELLDVLVEHRVVGDLAASTPASCGRSRQLAEQNQVGRLEVVAVLGELLDRVAAIEQDRPCRRRCR